MPAEVEFCQRTLPNGLEIVAECTPQAYSCAMGFFVKAGARDETDDLAGVSHFLEHMIFKGSNTRSAEDVNRQFDEIGARVNASTSDEVTCYYASFLPEYLGQVVEVWADILQPALREEDFEIEKQVILEEIQMYRDMPPYGGDDRVKALFFRDHPLSHSVLGTSESIGQLPVEQMRRYCSKLYSPSNVVLAASGKIDFEQLVDLAQQFCGHWTGPVVEHATVALKPSPPKVDVLCQPQSAQEYIMQLAAGPPGEGQPWYVAALLSVILGDETSSRLYWSLVDPGIAEFATLGYVDYTDCGVFFTQASCHPDRTEEVLKAIRDVYQSAAEKEITLDELESAKNKVASSLVRSCERPGRRMAWVGSDWTKRQQYRTVKEVLQAIASITPADLTSLLRHYSLNHSTTVIVGPRESLGGSNTC